MRDRKVLDESISELDKKENEERKRAGGLGKVRKVTELNLDKIIIQVLLFNTQSCPGFWDPMDCSTPVFLVLYQLLELAQTDVH